MTPEYSSHKGAPSLYTRVLRIAFVLIPLLRSLTIHSSVAKEILVLGDRYDSTSDECIYLYSLSSVHYPDSGTDDRS